MCCRGFFKPIVDVLECLEGERLTSHHSFCASVAPQLNSKVGVFWLIIAIGAIEYLPNTLIVTLILRTQLIQQGEQRLLDRRVHEFMTVVPLVYQSISVSLNSDVEDIHRATQRSLLICVYIAHESNSLS